jgi:hypothetical protein
MPSCSKPLFLIVILRVDLDEILPLFGDVLFGEDRLLWADRRARPAIYTRAWVNIELAHVGEVGLVGPRVNAINRTDLDAVGVLRARGACTRSPNPRARRSRRGCAYSDWG